MYFSLAQQQRLGLLAPPGGKMSDADEDSADGAAAEAAPLRAAAALGDAPSRVSVWRLADACGTRHGAVLLAFCAMGAVVMIVGTLTTAGVSLDFFECASLLPSSAPSGPVVHWCTPAAVQMTSMRTSCACMGMTPGSSTCASKHRPTSSGRGSPRGLSLASQCASNRRRKAS